MEHDLPLDEIPLRNPSTVSRETVDGGMVLVNSETGISVVMNSTGALIWSLIDGRRKPNEIAEEISRLFDDAPDTVGEDVSAHLLVLAKDGFIGYEVLPTSRSR